MGNERRDRELEVFDLFARAEGLALAPGSVEKRKPPEPDILYREPNGTPRAFELVELLDQDYGGRIGLLVGTKTALYTHYDNLPAEKRAAFEAKYGNALLYFRFLPDLTFKRRRSSFGPVFDRLLELPSEFTGEAFEDAPSFAGVLNGVSISRGRFKGPIFDPEDVGWIGDPTVPAIARKFQKIYQTPYPIELLAYIEINPMFPDEVWMTDLTEYLTACPRPLPFRRIWVFHAGRNEVKYRHEE